MATPLALLPVILVAALLVLSHVLVAQGLLSRARRDAAAAVELLALCWLGVGVAVLANALWTVAGVAGASSLFLGVAVLQLKIAGVVVGAFGLVGSMAAASDRSRRLLWLASGYYGALLLLLQLVHLARRPVGEHVDSWGMRLEYARGAFAPQWALALVLLLVVPPLVGFCAHALASRFAGEAARQRVPLLAAALVALFVAAPAVAEPVAASGWRLFATAGGVAAAAVALMVLDPPRWMRRRGGARGLLPAVAARETPLRPFEERERRLS